MHNQSVIDFHTQLSFAVCTLFFLGCQTRQHHIYKQRTNINKTKLNTKKAALFQMSNPYVKPITLLVKVSGESPLDLGLDAFSFAI